MLDSAHIWCLWAMGWMCSKRRLGMRDGYVMVRFREQACFLQNNRMGNGVALRLFLEMMRCVAAVMKAVGSCKGGLCTGN